MNTLKTFTLFFALTIFSAVSLADNLPNDFLNQLEDLQNPSFITTPNDDHSQLLAAFAEAKVSIKVGIFGISGKPIADGLVAAQKRGVAVTVICDKYCTTGDKRSAVFQQLKDAGVTLYLASPGFTISHWKMFIIDDVRVFISTMNFINRFIQMRDMGLFVTNPSIVKEVLSVFNADIENSKNQTALTPFVSQPNLIWSPTNSETKLVQLILSAEDTIDIWIENMGNPEIHKALKTSIANGVKVRLMTSLCSLGMDPTIAFMHLHELISFGIQVQVMPYPASETQPYIHAKVVVVDKKVTFLGSENLSYNSLLKARELGIIFKNIEIQKRISDLYESDWKATIPLPDKPPEKCEALQP